MPEKQIAILVPTRSRPEIFARFMESWRRNTSGKSDIVAVVDDDQLEAYSPVTPDTNLLLMPQSTLVRKLNMGAQSVFQDYPIVAFMGDDCVFQTPGWEDQVIDWQQKNKGICYCNDLLQEGNLPNNVFIHSEWIEALGFMAPPELHHYYIDNYWMDLGLRLRKLKYFHDIVIEHRHWSNQKAEKDELYTTAENSFMAKDQATWDAYRAPGGGLDRDVSAIIKHQNL